MLEYYSLKKLVFVSFFLIYKKKMKCVRQVSNDQSNDNYFKIHEQDFAIRNLIVLFFFISLYYLLNVEHRNCY